MKYRIKEKFIQSTDGQRKVRYYTEVDHCGKIDKDHFVKMLRENKCIPTVWTLSVLEAAAEYIRDMTRNGHVVELPYFGLFKIVAHTSAADEEKQAGSRSVRRLRLNFRPTKEILHDLDSMK